MGDYDNILDIFKEWNINEEDNNNICFKTLIK